MPISVVVLIYGPYGRAGRYLFFDWDKAKCELHLLNRWHERPAGDVEHYVKLAAQAYLRHNPRWIKDQLRPDEPNTAAPKKHVA